VIDAILGSRRLRLAFGLVLLTMSLVASQVPELALNALLLLFIGLYFTATSRR